MKKHAIYDLLFFAAAFLAVSGAAFWVSVIARAVTG